MKQVLICLDYDPSAQLVAEKAISFFETTTAKFTLLHVITDPVYYASGLYDPIMGFGGFINMQTMDPGITERLIVQSEEFLEKSKTHLGGKNIDVLVKEGNIPANILEAAEEIKADLIVMGSHSKGWLENVVLGSTAKHVLLHAPTPLFIIPVKKWPIRS
jgi:nucleotide-binding universal stress UspA family protein